MPQSFLDFTGGLDLTAKNKCESRLLQQLLKCCFKIKQIVVYLSFYIWRISLCLWMLDSRGFVNVLWGFIWVFLYSSIAFKAGIECVVPRNQ